MARFLGDPSRITLLLLQELGLSLDQLTTLTGENSDRLASCLLGVEPAPRWLMMLAILWSENPGSLERCRDLTTLLHTPHNGSA